MYTHVHNSVVLVRVLNLIVDLSKLLSFSYKHSKVYKNFLVLVLVISTKSLGFSWSFNKVYKIHLVLYLLDILKIKDLKTINRDCKKANKQDIRYYSIDSNGQDNIQLPL